MTLPAGAVRDGSISPARGAPDDVDGPGSHRRYRATFTRPDGTEGQVSTIVAQHTGDIPNVTLRQIEKDMDPAWGKGWSKR